MNESDRLVGFLRGRDTPCPGCGANLRDLLGTSCPSCGEALTVERIDGGERNGRHRSTWCTRSFVFGGLGLLSGFGVLGAIWPEVVHWDINVRARMPGMDDLRFVLLAGATVGAVILGGKWVDWSDEMSRQPGAFRWGCSAACWASVPLALLLGRIVGRW